MASQEDQARVKRRGKSSPRPRQRRAARQTPSGARPNREAWARPALLPGRLLESVGDGRPRGMIAEPRERGTEPGLSAGFPLCFRPGRQRCSGDIERQSIGHHLSSLGYRRLLLLEKPPTSSCYHPGGDCLGAVALYILNAQAEPKAKPNAGGASLLGYGPLPIQLKINDSLEPRINQQLCPPCRAFPYRVVSCCQSCLGC